MTGPATIPRRFTSDEIRDLRLTYAAELRGLDDASIDDELIGWIRAARRDAESVARRDLPAKKALARDAFEHELAKYTSSHPQGKNGRKSALRAARAIWSGFDA